MFALVKFPQFSQLWELLPSLGELRTIAEPKPPYEKEQRGPKELGGLLALCEVLSCLEN